MNELRTRGVNDILIAVVDGLNGFPEAINCISYDLIRRSVLAVRAVVSVGDGHAAMSFSFAKGSASSRV